MKRTLLSFLLSFLTLAATPAYGYKMDFSNHDWEKEWDFNARSLSLADGLPSKIGLTVQPRIQRLDVFGSIGKFASSRSGFVGFAQITTPLTPKGTAKEIAVTGTTQDPNLVIKLILKTSNTTSGSFQADFHFKETPSTLFFEESDFEFFVRGQKQSGVAPAEVSKTTQIGFLLTRSSQTKLRGETIPFDFSIHGISFQ